MRRALAAALALALVAALVFWISSQPGAAAPAGDVAEKATDHAPGLTAEVTSETPAPEPAPLQREQAKRAGEAPSPDEAVMRGRCVDEAGNPLAGVTAHLHGWGANQEPWTPTTCTTAKSCGRIRRTL